ncbi:MAG: TM0106 family RecB-like putative nuclease [Acidimicrobiia bacterium]|nr:TM0106 family RecB-like putative nuclease [Acidimicrobiia bacterium]
MMERNQNLVFSPTDLVNHLECRHLTGLNHAAATGDRQRPRFANDAAADLVRTHGLLHEQRCLTQLRADGIQVLAIDESADLAAQVAETEVAMRSGVQVIYQAVFQDKNWGGKADFLIRRDEFQTALGAYGYEVYDTKLSNVAKATALVQLAEYSTHIKRIQGQQPENVHLVLGDGRVESFALVQIAPYHRSVKADFEASVGPDLLAVYPDPVEHCSRCDWSSVCRSQRLDDDHLTLVADVGRSQATKLEAAGVTTLTELAQSTEREGHAGLDSFAKYQQQAALQLEQRQKGQHVWRLLEPVDADGPPTGFGRLPAPTADDLFFDIESDPFLTAGGLEYLFGITDRDDQFTPIWAEAASDERGAFERTMDLFMDALANNPEMHIYHFGIYEPTALKRLAARHGTRQADLDRLLRGGALIDLHQVTRQALQASIDSYSIKKLEVFYRDRRETELSSGVESAVEYEKWLVSGDRNHLCKIGEYNFDDCVSTRQLLDWLEDRRLEAEAKWGLIDRPPTPDPSPDPSSADAAEEVDLLRLDLEAMVPSDPLDRSVRDNAIWTLAQLLQWHAREERVDWWEHFDRLSMTDEELIDNSVAIGGMKFIGMGDPIRQSVVFRYQVPPQELRLKRGVQVINPANGSRAGTVEEVDFENWIVSISVGKRSVDSHTHPASIVPKDATIPARAQKLALKQLGEVTKSGGLEDLSSDNPAVASLLLRSPKDPIQSYPDALSEARARAMELDGDYLVIQGPPGAGKTYTSASIVCDLVAQGRRVALMANSHAVVDNLMRAVQAQAQERGLGARLARRQKERESAIAGVTVFASNAQMDAALAAGEVDVVGGTAFYFARREVSAAFDTLLVDEAGQISLANTLAAASAAPNLILVGDPQQLDQPARATHPEGADRSALAYLLGDSPTVALGHGVFLPETRRMHSAVTSFISEQFYEGRLASFPATDRQALSPAGVGIRFEEVEHTGNKSRSDEEIDRVDELVRELIGQEWTDQQGTVRPISPAEIMVVAPFNAQVAALKRRLGDRARIGTVDMFQGQEAAIVIYSMTSSDSTSAPRGMEFLYSTNRLNVAVSRAQGLAIVVASPMLLSPRCKTPEQVRLASALCRLAEIGAT